MFHDARCKIETIWFAERCGENIILHRTRTNEQFSFSPNCCTAVDTTYKSRLSLYKSSLFLLVTSIVKSTRKIVFKNTLQNYSYSARTRTHTHVFRCLISSMTLNTQSSDSRPAFRLSDVIPRESDSRLKGGVVLAPQIHSASGRRSEREFSILCKSDVIRMSFIGYSCE